MVTLNPNTVIEDSLETVFGLRSYIDILSVIQQDKSRISADNGNSHYPHQNETRIQTDTL
jgi:hypothetical protein